MNFEFYSFTIFESEQSFLKKLIEIEIVALNQLFD
jgi:hypothetical protein